MLLLGHHKEDKLNQDVEELSLLLSCQMHLPSLNIWQRGMSQVLLDGYFLLSHAMHLWSDQETWYLQPCLCSGYQSEESALNNSSGNMVRQNGTLSILTKCPDCGRIAKEFSG